MQFGVYVHLQMFICTHECGQQHVCEHCDGCFKSSTAAVSVDLPCCDARDSASGNTVNVHVYM